MASQNKILTSLNQALTVTNLYTLYTPGIPGQTPAPQPQSTLDGVILGTADQSSTGELGLKVIVIADRSASPSPSFGIPPYDTITSTYYGSTNNVQTQVYSLGGTTVRTLTFTYAGGGASNDDLVTVIAAS